MATIYGVTPAGFVIKRGADILPELQQGFQGIFGAGINLQPGSNFSNIIGYMMSREAAIWQLAQDIYNQRNSQFAQGVNLDNANALVAVKRLGLVNSLQQGLLLFGTVGAVIPHNTKVYPQGNSQSIFTTNSDVTLIAGTNEVQHITFSAVPTSGSWFLQFNNQVTASLAFNITAAALQTALNLLTELVGVTVTGDFTAGFTITYAGAAGSIPQPLIAVVTNTLLISSTAITTTITRTTTGIPQGVTDATCTVQGAIPAPAYSLTGITTPVTGLTSVLNIVDAVPGRLAESDPAYRTRAAVAQSQPGAGTVPALRAAILALTGVTTCTVFENVTLSTDGNGLPAKSFLAYVQGGANQDIWNTVWLKKPAGIQPFGAISGTTVDSQGRSQTVAFSRPIQVPIFVTLNIVHDPTSWPTNGVAQVQAAIAAYVNGLGIGQTVITFPHVIAAMNNIAGILGITAFKVDTNPAFPLNSNANIAISINQIALVVNPATDITVTVS
jgi:uncharacterized phage protein gp47/JayE